MKPSRDIRFLLARPPAYLRLMARAEWNQATGVGGWPSYEMVLRYAHLIANHLKIAADWILGTTRNTGRINALEVSGK